MSSDDLLATISGLLPATVAPAAAPQVAMSPQLRDPFARRAGPDVRIVGPNGATDVYSLFVVDPATHRVRIEMVDSQGRLLRAVPAPSTGEMLAAMASYRRR